MHLTVLVTPHEGQFTASVLGSSEVSAVGSTKPAAVESLKVKLWQLQSAGELVTIEMPPVAIADLIGTYTTEQRESLREIVAEAYRLRDEEKAREFPE
jgi:hypothetical protein